MTKYTNPGVVSFDAGIRRYEGGGSFVEFPFDAKELFGTRARVPIVATIDGADYRGSLTPYNGVHMIVVLLALQQQIGKGAGDTVHVELSLDTAERVVELDDDIVAALAESSRLDQFRAMSYSHQREYALWIASAKKAETRQARIEKMLTLLAEGKRLK